MKFFIGIFFFAVSINFGYTTTDTPEGWASLNGGTTGGSGGEQVTVTTSEELKKAVESKGKMIIIVKKGNYSGEIKPQSNKSILGIEPGVVLDGTLRIVEVQNVIVRNIAVINSKKCGSYQECKKGSDAIYVGLGAKNVWLDHLDVSDGQDGNCDVTRAADFVTITWCKFWYTYNKDHAFSNLIAGSNDETESRGKLNITYAYCWWADRCQERQPWGRFGKIHILNNLYTSQRARYACASGKEMQMLIENNVFNNNGQGYLEDGGAYKCIGNIGTNKHITGSKGTVFTPSYKLTLKMDASKVETKVKAAAGNTLTLNTTTARKQVQKNIAISPYIITTKSGCLLYNPTATIRSFTVVTLDGQTVLPATTIKAGSHVPLPVTSSTLCVKFNDSNALSNRYLPFLFK